MSAGTGHGFQFWQYLHNDFLNANPHIAAGTVAATVLIAGATAYAVSVPKLKASADDKEFVPPAKLNLRNTFDLIGEFVQNLAKDVIGHEYYKYLPVLIFIFMWTLLNNCLGMIPGLGSATDNLNTTIAMGLSVFVYYNFLGFKSHGIKYLEQYTGHMHGWLLLFLGPVLFVIELISHAVRPMTLGIRLRSNIYGDHTVFSIFSALFNDLGAYLGKTFGPVGEVFGALVSSLGPVPIVILGLMVCVIQAFVFTLLTTIYIGIATAHDEH